VVVVLEEFELLIHPFAGAVIVVSQDFERHITVLTPIVCSINATLTAAPEAVFDGIAAADKNFVDLLIDAVWIHASLWSLRGAIAAYFLLKPAGCSVPAVF
jgi:hypothetical protein